MGKQSLLICVLGIMLLSGCGCSHEKYSDADCTEPSKCLSCGKTEGIPMGHQWLDADCINAETCAVCGETKGEPRGHSWKEATKSSPQSCIRCGATRGEALMEEPVFEEVYDLVCNDISAQFRGADFVYDQDFHILYVSIAADKGTAEAIVLNPESVYEYWTEVSANICSVSYAAHDDFCEAGFAVDCCVFLISDVNEDNALLAAKNGTIYYDVTE